MKRPGEQRIEDHRRRENPGLRHQKMMRLSASRCTALIDEIADAEAEHCGERVTDARCHDARESLVAKTGRRTRLFQRMRARKSLFLQAELSDARDIRIGLGPTVEELTAYRVADETDVGERQRVAAAIFAGYAVVCQVRLERLV